MHGPILLEQPRDTRQNRTFTLTAVLHKHTFGRSYWTTPGRPALPIWRRSKHAEMIGGVSREWVICWYCAVTSATMESSSPTSRIRVVVLTVSVHSAPTLVRGFPLLWPRGRSWA